MARLIPLKNYLQFMLSLVTILSVLLVGWYLKVDVSGSLVAVFGIYITGRSLTFGAAAVSASRDNAADTRAVIGDVHEK
jgi:hypothetical protein